MKFIYLIAGTYRPAGMERVLSMKARWLSGDGHEVVIVTTDQRGRAPVFGLDRYRRIDLDINYESTNGAGFLKKFLLYFPKHWKHRRALREVLMREKAEFVVSMFNNDADFVPSIKDGSKKILEVHFSRFKKLQYDRGGLWALADRWRTRSDVRSAARFDRFVTLTEEDKGYWEADYARLGLKSNVVCIPNARTFSCAEPAALDTGIVLAAGRYTYQKGFDLLLNVWKIVKEDSAADLWKLRIAGEGEDADALRNQAEALGIDDSVVLGPTEDMRREFESASVFAFSSRFEGFGMVLAEAQAAGVPMVSFACKCGPSEIVSDGEDGFLVPELDVEAMADSLSRLMRDDGLRRRMGEAAFRNSARFDEKVIYGRWKALFESFGNVQA